MLDDFVFVEVDNNRGGEHVQVHRVNMLFKPERSYGHPNWIVSIDAFRSHALSDAPPELVKCYRNSCAWDHKNNRLYWSRGPWDEFVADMTRLDTRMRKVAPDFPSDLDLPVIAHENPLAFYRYINFDNVRRRYNKVA